jgi:hypothetical protein
VNDPAFSAGHWIEVKGNPGSLHFFCRGQSAHSKLFNAQQTIIIGIE